MILIHRDFPYVLHLFVDYEIYLTEQVVYLIYRWKLFQLRREMGSAGPAGETTLQAVLGADETAKLKAAEGVLERIGLKLQRTASIGLLRSRTFSWLFMIIYLLYPGTSATGFRMFR